ncbi:MAG TPA: hypothetical protein VFS21_16645 [Roseiflexaceae bacterium]|nr:hypothetical protein [Roseiflexaceae bacterium]
MELQFLLMVDTKRSNDEIIFHLKEQLSDVTSVRSRSFDWLNNWVQVWENDDFDPEKALDSEEGFLYYPFRIEVSPVAEEVTLEHQLVVARSLRASLEMLNAKVQICADFEDML